MQMHADVGACLFLPVLFFSHLCGLVEHTSHSTATQLQLYFDASMHVFDICTYATTAG